MTFVSAVVFQFPGKHLTSSVHGVFLRHSLNDKIVIKKCGKLYFLARLSSLLIKIDTLIAALLMLCFMVYF